MHCWSIVWRTALARRRLFAWNVAVPLLLLAPVALSEAAAPHRTAVFGLFFVFFAAFGSAVPTVRDAGSGYTDSKQQARVNQQLNIVKFTGTKRKIHCKYEQRNGGP